MNFKNRINILMKNLQTNNKTIQRTLPKGVLMKRASLFSALALAAVVFSGCNLFGPTDDFRANDGNAGTVAYELNDVGNAGLEIFTGETRALDDTININITVIPWQYNDACGAWVRTATGTIETGTVGRYDTVWLYDANNQAVKIPSLATVSHFKHVRSVVGNYNHTFDYRYVMNVDIVKGTDTVFVFNGTLDGTFDGQKVETTVITNVKRRLVQTLLGKALSFPYEGTISIDRPYRTIYIEFLGTNLARATVTRKSDGKTWIITINITTGAESN